MGKEYSGEVLRVFKNNNINLVFYFNDNRVIPL